MAENPGTDTVQNLLQEVHTGAYVIPYFQRGFEWQPSMVCDLVQSILQDYYTGLILLWDLDPEDAAKEEWDAVWGAERCERPKPPDMAILDGQQRLASLYYAIYNPQKRFPNRKSYYVFSLDMNCILNEEYEEAVGYKYYASHSSWEDLWGDGQDWAEEGVIPLPVLSAQAPTGPGKKYIDTPEFQNWINLYIEQNSSHLPDDIIALRVYQVLNGILQYSFVCFPLSSNRGLPDICNIFARVNEKGMKLSTFDLMNAFLYPKGISLRKDLWENLDNDALKDAASNMNEYLLKLISLVKQNYCSSKYMYNLVPGQKVLRRAPDGSRREEIIVKDADDFKSLWSNACSYAEKARRKIMNTGAANFGAVKPSFIPNTTIIPVLGAMLWISDAPEDANFNRYLLQWYWSAVLSEDYSGSSDTVMSEDFRAWQHRVSEGSLRELPRRLQMVDVDFIRNLDLTTVKRGSARYNAMICLLALNDARDFYQGMIVGSVDYSDERINDHHIFPSGSKPRLDPKKSTQFMAVKDTILNRTLLYNETNQRISSRTPSEYIAEMVQKHGDEQTVRKLLSAHLISRAAFECMKDDDFDRFITEREGAIKDHLISFLHGKS